MVAILRPLTLVVQSILALSPEIHGEDPAPFKLNYTDSLVAPTPASHYERYITFLNVGDRTYKCDTTNETSPYSLKTFDYDMYDAESDPNHKHSLGKHILSRDMLTSTGYGSIFYTSNNTFTYWVGRGTMALSDPSATSPLDIGLEQTLRAEASEPKAVAGKYDLGIAVYATRFGAVGGLLPPGTKCTGDRTVKSKVYYSMWKQVL